jgi:hypothetical protein
MGKGLSNLSTRHGWLLQKKKKKFEIREENTTPTTINDY